MALAAQLVPSSRRLHLQRTTVLVTISAITRMTLRTPLPTRPRRVRPGRKLHGPVGLGHQGERLALVSVHVRIDPPLT